MERPRDYYQILGVPRDATSAAIKRAFRRLAKKYHPDVTTDVSPEAFQELQAAYETLTDAEQRRRYDETLGGERLEPLAWSFVRSPAVGDLRRPFHPGSLSGEILLSPQEATAGGVTWAVGTTGCTSGCTQNALIARYGPLCLTPTPAPLPGLPGHGGLLLRLRALPGRGQGGPSPAGSRAHPPRGARRPRLPGHDRRPGGALDPPDRPHPLLLTGP